MIAFTLSGGANRGPMQVGALIALTEHGIVPNVVTGTSAGALNGMGLCLMPGLDGLAHLSYLWQNTRRSDVWPGHRLSWAWAIIAGELGLRPKPLGLVSYQPLLTHIEKALDFIFRRHDLVYSDLQIPLLVTAVDVTKRIPVTFGYSIDANIPLSITVAASAAMPGASEPVPYMDTLLSDGGITNPLPIDIAVKYGATEVYALDLSGTDNPYRPTNILEALISYFDSQQNELARRGIQQALDFNVTLHHIRFSYDIPLWNFDYAADMIRVGHETMEKYLQSPAPLRVRV